MSVRSLVRCILASLLLAGCSPSTDGPDAGPDGGDPTTPDAGLDGGDPTTPDAGPDGGDPTTPDASVPAPQVIVFTSTAPDWADVDGTPYSVTASATSGLTPTFTVDPSSAEVCSVSASTVFFTATGVCILLADQAGNASFEPAPQARQVFPVGKGLQTIAFTSTAPSNASVGGAPYTVTATATSGLAPTFAVDPAAASVCSVSGSTVSFSAVGTCVITANQAGDANYHVATSAPQSFAVGKGVPTLDFTLPPPATAAVGTSAPLVATTLPGLSVSLSSQSLAVCAVAGGRVSFHAVGTCVVLAATPVSPNYQAGVLNQSITVTKAAQTITFTSLPSGAPVNGSYIPTATASSGLAPTFSVAPAAASVCAFAITEPSRVDFKAIGTCEINADQGGNGSYEPAPTKSMSFGVGLNPQSITVTSTAPSTAAVDGPFYLTQASSSSGLTVERLSLTPSVCSIRADGLSVLPLAAGTCTVRFQQLGDSVTWGPAPALSQTYAVGKASQTVSFAGVVPTGVVVGATRTQTASATSSLPATIGSATPAICTYSGATVSFNATGTCTLGASQAGDANYNPASMVQRSMSVGKGNQEITFTSLPTPFASSGGDTYSVSATASSGLSVSITSATTAVCTIAGSTVSFVDSGVCVLEARQVGNGNYNAALVVQQSFEVYGAPVITSASSTSFTASSPGSFTVTTMGHPSGALMVLSLTGALPPGVTFVDNRDGTATLAGTPDATAQGVYPLVITANNAEAPTATQSFTLTVD